MGYIFVVVLVIVLIIPLTFTEEIQKEKIPKKNIELDRYIKVLTTCLDNNFYLFKKQFEIPQSIEYDYYNSISYRQSKLFCFKTINAVNVIICWIAFC